MPEASPEEPILVNGNLTIGMVNGTITLSIQTKDPIDGRNARLFAELIRVIAHRVSIAGDAK